MEDDYKISLDEDNRLEIRKRRKTNMTAEEIYESLDIKEKKYYKLLDEDYLCQICELRKDDLLGKNIYEYLEIPKEKYDELLDKNNLDLIEGLKKCGCPDKDIYEYLKITEEEYFKLLDISPSSKKNIASNEISRDNLKYIRIDNYRDIELYRGIIVEAITRINGSEEPFQTKELSTLEFIQKDIQPMIDIQNIRDTMLYDKRKIKDEIQKISNYPESNLNKDTIRKLKDNDWAIRTAIRIFNLEENLIIKVFKRLSIVDYPPLFTNEYNHYDLPEKDFIDILNGEIDHKYQYSHKGKKWGAKFEGRNIELVKYYLLKYIQKPILKYGIDYSNTLLGEYNFQKIFLEIDMAIPKEEQKKLMEKTIEDLYSKKMPLNYLEFIARKLLEDGKDIKYNKVYKGREAERHKSLSERVSDLFYIYDLRVHKTTYASCAESLSDFYKNKGIEVDITTSTIHYLSNIISSFMEEFRKKYKIQPSLLYRNSPVRD